MFEILFAFLVGVGLGVAVLGRKLLRQSDRIAELEGTVIALRDANGLLKHFLELRKKADRKRENKGDRNGPGNIWSGGTQG